MSAGIESSAAATSASNCSGETAITAAKISVIGARKPLDSAPSRAHHLLCPGDKEHRVAGAEGHRSPASDEDSEKSGTGLVEGEVAPPGVAEPGPPGNRCTRRVREGWPR